MKRFVSALVLSLAAATATALGAQVNTGSLVGVVTDVQGAPVAKAVVTVQGVDARFTQASNADGEFRILNLAPGTYDVSVASDKLVSVKYEVIIAAGRNTTLDVQVLSLSEVVTVAGGTFVDRNATGLPTTFGSDRLTEIPSVRDIFALGREVAGVVLEQVNVGGNETGQQPVFFAKGLRPQDTIWLLEGVDITDQAAPGQSPLYFNFDSFEEVMFSTAGNDITMRTGGLGINMITRRGGNALRGSVRGYFSNGVLEAVNIPDELSATVTPATADHTLQNTDYGFDVGGPILKDRLWFYGAASQQDIRLYRRTVKGEDRTQLRNPQLKVNWKASSRDMVNFFYMNGYKLKDGRSNATANGGVSFEEFSATHHQTNAYSDSPFHGMWKIGADRVASPNLFISAKYSYFNGGLKLTPEGGMDAQAGRSVPASSAYGSTVQSLNIRPQHFVGADTTQILDLFGQKHNLKYGFSFRHVYNATAVEWPGNGILGIIQSADANGVPTDTRAQVFRQSFGANTTDQLAFYAGDTLHFQKMTVDFGLRYDRQSGDALASVTSPNKGLPDVVPGAIFPGYDNPFVWKNFSPRVGVSYQLDTRTVARVSWSNYAGQINSTLVGTRNTSTGSTPGNAIYGWNDTNGDRFVQADEVDLSRFINSSGGFNPNDKTALAPSANKFGPLDAPTTQSTVAGVEHEIMQNLVVLVAYTYNRVSDLYGNLSNSTTPRVGVPLSAYVDGPRLTGTLPDGTAYSVPTFKPTGVTAGFVTQTIPGYYTDYHGFEVDATKRFSDKWMGRVMFAYNNPREHFTDPAGRYNTNGNPTGTVTEPLIDGGQMAPTNTSIANIYLNAKWQVNINGMYEAPYGIQVAANVFGRQGYPFPIYRGGISLGSDTSNVLVSPALDHFRYDDIWLTDMRVARDFTVTGAGRNITFRLMADVFNLFNANTELIRINNIGGLGDAGNLVTPASNFNTLTKNVSPRVMRLGLNVRF